MLQKLCAAWRARRVVISGDGQSAAPQLCAWLTILGARPACLPQDADSETLFRALTCPRTAAVIVCTPPAGDRLLTEIREAGVPLTLLLAPGDAQESAMQALRFGARFFTEGELPCGVYDLGEGEAREE